MPRKPIDFSRAIIYKLQHIDNDELLIVDSTTDFIKRKSQHKINCESKDGRINHLIRENGGWSAWSMVQLCECPCNNKRELEAMVDTKMRELRAT